MSDLCFVLRWGEVQAMAYRRLFPNIKPFAIGPQLLYGGHVHGFLEMGEATGKIKRIAFLLMHPGAFFSFPRTISLTLTLLQRLTLGDPTRGSIRAYPLSPSSPVAWIASKSRRYHMYLYAQSHPRSRTPGFGRVGKSSIESSSHQRVQVGEARTGRLAADGSRRQT